MSLTHCQEAQNNTSCAKEKINGVEQNSNIPLNLTSLVYIDGLVQERHTSITNAPELCLALTHRHCLLVLVFK